MARPCKEGLDYFPLDIDFIDDSKFLKLLVRHGEQGVVVALRLLAEIYRNGYWLLPDTDVLAYKFRTTADELNAILSTALEAGLFSGEVHTRHGVLTSRGIQLRFVEATRKRKMFALVEEYWLLGEEEVPEGFRRGKVEEALPKPDVIAEETDPEPDVIVEETLPELAENVEETLPEPSGNAPESAQRKGKKRKEEERKERVREKNTRTPEPSARSPDEVPVGVECLANGSFRLVPVVHDAEGRGVFSSEAVLFVTRKLYEVPERYDKSLRAWIETHGNRIPNQHDVKSLIRLVDRVGDGDVTSGIRRMGDKGHLAFTRLEAMILAGGGA